MYWFYKLTTPISSFPSVELINCRTHLHNPHQHQQSGGSCEIKAFCLSTLTDGWNLRNTEHHQGKLVHCQHQSGHYCMPCHLYVHVEIHSSISLLDDIGVYFSFLTHYQYLLATYKLEDRDHFYLVPTSISKKKPIHSLIHSLIRLYITHLSLQARCCLLFDMFHLLSCTFTY